MIDATHKLKMTRQAELLAISRSNLYYLPRPTSDADLALMRRIDELHLNYPFAGSRSMANCCVAKRRFSRTRPLSMERGDVKGTIRPSPGSPTRLSIVAKAATSCGTVCA